MTTPTRQTIDREFQPDVPVGQLTPHPKNERVHDRESIREGLEANPQYKPVVVQTSTSFIIAGNGTYSVATEDLGWESIDAFYVDVDDATALRILAGDNGIGRKSYYEDDAMARLLSGIIDATGGLDGTGWNYDDYDDVLARLSEEGSEAVEELNVPGPPPVWDSPPATNATFAETPEEEAERADKLASQTPHHAKGISEAVLPFTDDDKAEFTRLVGDARKTLGADLRTPEIVLRSLRVLLAALDAKDSPETIDMAGLLKAADYAPDAAA